MALKSRYKERTSSLPIASHRINACTFSYLKGVLIKYLQSMYS